MAKHSSKRVSRRRPLSKRLVSEVKRILTRVYAPYSHIKVAAGLYCSDGSIFTGVNIENGSYSLTMCAERVAVFNALSAGQKNFLLLLVYSPQIEYIVPCGSCLQVLHEFAPELMIVSMNKNNTFKFFPLKTLLTQPFTGVKRTPKRRR